jgi:hypothetical protein
VILQIFFDGGYAAAGIGDPDGVRFAQFVMHQQFANHCNPEMSFRHMPDLTSFQGLLATAAAQLAFAHNSYPALELPVKPAKSQSNSRHNA